MYGSLVVIVVCATAHRLYERGDGTEALFLLAFTLSQLLMEDARTR